MITIDSYIKEIQANGQAAHTLINVEQTLRYAGQFKPLSKWKDQDVTRYILELQKTYKPSSIEYKKAVLKRFFKRAGKGDIVEHVKIKFIKGNLNREDILTVDDVNNLIAYTESPMYKALFSFLFESGARISEVLNVKVEDIQETDRGMIIAIPQTKTGTDKRRALYVYSAGYIRNHLTYSGLKKGDKLFGITRPAVHLMLQKVGKEAGIDKPLSPHKFRHASATDMLLRGYQDPIVKKKHGWTADSRMIARYQHIVDDDVINAEAEKKNGADTIKRPIRTIKQAESLNIATSQLQLSKLSAENQELRAKFEEQQKQMNKQDRERELLMTLLKEKGIV
ncbi:MAG: tyrosine-type recombinase/integrase [Candidatus Methanoperedens sp.]|nr:tyrosine-type recombinase/integrase [Candidatus Methanoperedens sp.]MCZ7395295.1 tyrosine-type recombinase/integrase [Candidatus Methanoperedens sp.]